MNDYRRFRFVKNLTVEEGTFLAGSEITIMGNRIYYNGGMIQPAYYDLFYDLIEYETNEGFNYLREIPIPINKI